MLPNPIFWNVHMYGVMVAVGILAAFCVLFYCCKKKGIETRFVDFIFYNAILSIALGFGAAALFQATYDYIENPAAGFNLGGGITFIGGFIGGALAFLAVYFIFRKKYTSRLLDVLSIIPACILIGHAFGRIGCFFAGCCHGKTTDSIFGVKFPNIPGKVLPTQLYEAAFLFILFGITLYLVMKKNFRHNLSVYFICYGIFRFLIEFLRGDNRGSLVGGISPSQFWSILMIVIGVALFFFLHFVFPIKKESESAETNCAESVSAETSGERDEENTADAEK